MVTAGSERRLRRDAAQNAERLMAAAIRAGVTEGRQVPMAQIAADAGVGVGTLYRRYPNRQALLSALQVRAYGLLIADAEHALATATDGLDAIGRYLATSFEHRDELVLPMHGVPIADATEAARLAGRIRDLIVGMVDRGHADGSVRDDVSAWTVVRFGAMLAQPMTTTTGWAETAAEQRVVFLRGIAGVSRP